MSNKYYLYLDTSEPEAVLAIYLLQGETLLKQGLTLVEKESWEAGRQLSATLSEQYSNILENVRMSQDDLVGIVVFVGPGSFTGLRIGISFANGLAFALGIPVYETKEKEIFDLKNRKEIALPFYGSEPKTTKPKK